MRKLVFIILFLIGFCCELDAQIVPVGAWQSYYPYNAASAVTVAGQYVYSGKYGLLEYNTLTNEYTVYSKVNGLSDVNISHLAWDASSESLLITYENSNIDILKNKRIYNIPDIKNVNIVASKKINQISIIDNAFYLSTGLGIIIIDPVRQEIKEQYAMLINSAQSIVYDVQQVQDSLVTLTDKGIFKAPVNSQFLKDMNSWKFINAAEYKQMCIADNNFFLRTDDAIVQWDGQQLFSNVYNSTLNIYDFEYTNNYINISEFSDVGMLTRMKLNGAIEDTLTGQSALDLEIDGLGNIWMANVFGGLASISQSKQVNYYTINGPTGIDGRNLKIIKDELYLISGGIDGLSSYNATHNRIGFSILRNNNFIAYNQYVGIAAMDTVNGIMDVELDPKTQSIYAASFGGGLMEIDKFGKVSVKKNDNEITSGVGSVNLCSYLHYDNDGNLWHTVSNTPKNLVVKKKDGTWQTFEIPTGGEYKVMGDFVIDNSNQLWIILPRSRGVLVYNHNNTIDNKNDDKYKIYFTGKNDGNLASNQVLCIAKDKDGKIWIGTDNGISIVNCAESAFSVDGCMADNKTVQYDIAAGYLFAGEGVTSIAVDGANRKWIGTSNGVWLISSDADSIRTRFTVNNSPLPSNEIFKIAINPTTGLVYFSTLAGLVSYRGAATDGAMEITEPTVFPNPVTANYTGNIAIKGLTENADIRIMDASGKLVFRTKALGGQAIWDGKTYTGYRPNSGVFFVLASNEDGTVMQETKLVFIQ
jgi:ligand-binding sensor domain-containing protein